MKFYTICALFAFTSVNSVVLQSGRNMNIRPSEKQIDRHYENPKATMSGQKSQVLSGDKENMALHKIFNDLDTEGAQVLPFNKAAIGLEQYSEMAEFTISDNNWQQLQMLFHGPNLIGGQNLDFNEFSLFAREFRILAGRKDEQKVMFHKADADGGGTVQLNEAQNAIKNWA